MLILVPINQTKSIAAGVEAPHSTELVEVPLDAIPETLRMVIASAYDPKMHHIKLDGKSFHRVRSLALVKPVTIPNTVAALLKFYKQQYP